MQNTKRFFYILFSFGILVFIYAFAPFFTHSQSRSVSAHNSWAFSQESQPKSVIQNKDGRLEFFIIAADGALWHTWQNAAGTWPAGQNNWSSLGNPVNESFDYNSFTLMRNGDGRLEVSVLAKDGSIWNRTQLQPNGVWNDWFSLPNPANTTFSVQPVALQNQNVKTGEVGKIEEFEIDANGQVWHNWQGGANHGWNGWVSLASPQNGTITANQITGNVNVDGRLEIAIAGSDGNIWNEYQLTATGDWSPSWGLINTNGATNVNFKDAHITLSASQNGILTLFAIGDDGNLWSTNQTVQDWSNWYRIDASAQFASNAHLAVMPSPDNTLEVFVVTPDGKLKTFKQATVNGNWIAGNTNLGFTEGTNDYNGDRFHISPNADGTGNVFLYNATNGVYEEAHQTTADTNLNSWSKAVSIGYPTI